MGTAAAGRLRRGRQGNHLLLEGGPEHGRRDAPRVGRLTRLPVAAMGTAGSNCRVDGRFGVFATCLLQTRCRLLPVCYAEPSPAP